MTDEPLPELDDESLDLWLGCLADQELEDSQRAELLCFFDQHPEYWRRCAVALWDGQLLQKRLPAALQCMRPANSVASQPEPAKFAGHSCEASLPPEVMVKSQVHTKGVGW